MSLLIVLDTNIPLLINEHLFNLENEIKRIIPQKHKIVFLSACMEELDFIQNKSNKLFRGVKFAKEYLKRFEIINFNPIEIRTTDDKIRQFAIENKFSCVVVTNDRKLRYLLRNESIPVLFIKKQGFIELIGSIS